MRVEVSFIVCFANVLVQKVPGGPYSSVLIDITPPFEFIPGGDTEFNESCSHPIVAACGQSSLEGINHSEDIIVPQDANPQYQEVPNCPKSVFHPTTAVTHCSCIRRAHVRSNR